MRENVLIIGASGDIGIAIAEQLANEGYQLILHYHQNREPISMVYKTIKECVLTEVQADLTDPHDVENMIANLMYPVHSIVFASGKAHYGLFQETPEQTINDMLSMHVKAPLFITKHFLPAMINRKSGKIVFITSIWGHVGASFEVVYSTVKGAQNSFVKSLAKEVGPSGISVNGVCPGFIDTKMNEHLRQEEKEAIISDIPMNRSGSPKDVAHTVRFLLDDASNYIQGEIIKVTGGW